MNSKIQKTQLLVKNPQLALGQEVIEISEILLGIKEHLDRSVSVVKGEPGDTPTKKELIELIKPLIPEVEDGYTPVKGKDYRDGLDAKMPKKGVDYFDGVPGYTPVKNKDYFDGVPGYTPVKGKDYFDGNIKDLSPQEIRDALELLSKGEKLSIQSIEDLGEIIEELRKFKKEVGSGGGGGFTSPIYNFVDDEVPAGTINGTNTVFTVARLPFRGSLKLYRGGARQRVTEDYTLSADQKTVTFLIAPQVGEILLVDYRTL